MNFSNRILIKILIFSLCTTGTELRSMQTVVLKSIEMLPAILRSISLGAAVYLSNEKEEVQEEQNLRIKINKAKTNKEKVLDFFIQKAKEIGNKDEKISFTSSFAQNQSIDFAAMERRLRADTSKYNLDKSVVEGLKSQYMKEYVFKQQIEKEQHLDKFNKFMSIAEVVYGVAKDINQSVKIAREIIELEEYENKCILEQCKNNKEFRKAYQEAQNFSFDLLSEICDITHGKYNYSSLLKANTLNLKGDYGREYSKLINLMNGYFFNTDGTRNKNVVNHEKEIQAYFFDFLKSIAPNREVYLSYLNHLEKRGYKSAKCLLKDELKKNNFKNKTKTGEVPKKVTKMYTGWASKLAQKCRNLFGSEWNEVDQEAILKNADNKALLSVVEILRDNQVPVQVKIKKAKELLATQLKTKTDNGQMTFGEIHTLVGAFEHATCGYSGQSSSDPSSSDISTCTGPVSSLTKDLEDISTCPSSSSKPDETIGCGTGKIKYNFPQNPTCDVITTIPTTAQATCNYTVQSIPTFVGGSESSTDKPETEQIEIVKPQKEEELDYVSDEDKEVEQDKDQVKEDEITAAELHDTYIEEMNEKLKGKEKELEVVYDKTISVEKNKKIARSAALNYDDPVKALAHLMRIKKAREVVCDKVFYDKDGNVIKPRCVEHISQFQCDYKKGSGKPTRLAGGHLDYNGELEELGKKDKKRVQVKIAGKKYKDFYQVEYEWCGVKSDTKDMYPKSWDDAKCQEKAMEAMQNIQSIENGTQTREYMGKTKDGDLIIFIVSKGNGHVLTHYPAILDMIDRSSGNKDA